MATSDLRPSTIEGIKRLAKSIKRELQVPHSKALDLASRRAGFQNLKHAQRQLQPRPGVGSPRHQIYITAYWRAADGRSGRETLSHETSVQWPKVLRRAEVQTALGLFRVDADDHFETRDDVRDQERAREVVCHAARTLQFMEATGLRPATSGMRSFSRIAHGLPAKDHQTLWVDPEMHAQIVVDEPYHEPAELLPARTAWATERAMAVLATRWGGMYVPGDSHLFLTTEARSAAVLERCVGSLDRLKRCPTSNTWNGESAPYSPVFVSPARQSTGARKRARALPPFPGQVRNGAIAFGAFLMGMSWRPNARMPIEAHAEAGNLLKELLADRRTSGTRLGSVRSSLDEWLQREYTAAELPDAKFFSTYYHEGTTSGRSPRDAAQRVCELLTLHYPDCVPRRELLRWIATAHKRLA